MLRVIIAILALSTAQVQAGAWPREKGSVFLSYSLEIETEAPYQTYGTIYGEYGVTDKLTLGLDLGGDDTVSDKAFVFARYPGKPAAVGILSAWEIAIGMAENELAFRPGVSIGRGIKWVEIDGWLGLETRSIIFSNGLAGDFEADATLGLSVTKQSKLIFQLQGRIPPIEPAYIKLAPSYIFEQRSGRHLEAGIITGVMGTDELKLKFGAWHHF
ncbi:hypothetical protein ROA7450_00335 [Roseovarius albus]|uniref:Outer membrane protein beta-barrel domain-containing protein n=1 Tax=Roseovarius albus TaxID=1247867 RepID=A0A1X6YB26_9RHOB|nr:hypothetical protein [Roseovarius albus]SLN15270.1 hypothetical protein ROA7450_00335 [Roseovarius albus]